MTQFTDPIVLGPMEEADRLWKGALRAFETAGADLVSLCEALDLGLRAAEILVHERLRPEKGEFPATIGLLLETPLPEVDAHRDSIESERTLQFSHAVDLLSDTDLSCVSPGLHRGWEDRRFACRRSRETAQRVTGVTLTEVDRERLLLLAAYRNRIFRTPPPVRIVPEEVLSAYKGLDALVGNLLQGRGETART